MIPIADPEIGADERQRVDEVLESGYVADGPEVRSFEEEFATFCEAAHGVATSNGTTALHAALVALGIGDGDHVLTSPFSFIASANAIRFTGAEPVFADIDPETYTLNPRAVKERIAELDGGIDALVPVHLYGLPAEIGHLRDIADSHDIPILEDAAQAHGAAYDGDRVGSLGDAACFSFYPTKNMTTAEGGMITTDRDDVRERAERFVNHGRTGNYEHANLGHNFRMTSVAAAIGRAQLDRLPEFNETRRDNAAALTDHIDNRAIQSPVEPDGRRHVYHQYTVRTRHRDQLADHLETHGVGSSIYYPRPIHEQPAYDAWSPDAPESERAAKEVLSLPVHPNVNKADVRTIGKAINKFNPTR